MLSVSKQRNALKPGLLPWAVNWSQKLRLVGGDQEGRNEVMDDILRHERKH